MISFESDYIQGAHPRILERLTETNLVQQPGYGNDIYCRSAAEKIKEAFSCPDAQVFFISGGTQSNAIVIDSMLRPYQGVMAAATGHINGHEAGAIEFTGHKVLSLPEHDGKVAAADVEAYIRDFSENDSHDHMIFPGMVYISHPTEYGTLYSKSELTALSETCRRHNIPLYMDGARLGYGLMSYDTDVTAADIAALCDVFYIGGTKVGALCGEAVVFSSGKAPDHFFTIVKQRGALLAKGRLLGVQFETLFTDGLYFTVGRHAIDMAEKMKAVFREKGYAFFKETATNQQFIVVSDEQKKKLDAHVASSYWEKADDTHTVLRFATSWATTEEDIRQLAEAL